MVAKGPLSKMLHQKILLKLHSVSVNSIYIESLNRLTHVEPVLQQDVSEFTHKLLDWLEDAFQMQAEEER